MVRVAIDAMGGDLAPHAEIDGALEALAAYAGECSVQLVGHPEVIGAALRERGAADHPGISIVPAASVIGMGEKPLAAIRKKPDSSLVVAIERHRDGHADAVLSAGNTGAILAGATVLFGLHPGVERATVATLLPAAGGPVFVLDAGANVDCSARELLNFAYLGTQYVRDMHGRPTPLVGLLNVGEEEGKGNAVAKEAYGLLKEAPGLNFLGNIEGRDVVAGHPERGRADVVICDGFTGNILLKFYESMQRVLIQVMQESAPALLKSPELAPVFKFLDYSQYGGAPLLGVRGTCIICHGSSNANAIKNGIRVAVQAVKAGLTQHIGAQCAQRDGAARA